MSEERPYKIGQTVLVVPTDRLGQVVGFQYVVRTSGDMLEAVDASQVIGHCDHGVPLGVKCEGCMGGWSKR